MQYIYVYRRIATNKMIGQVTHLAYADSFLCKLVVVKSMT